MSLVGAAVIQADLRKAGQLDFAGPIAVIDERHRAHFASASGATQTDQRVSTSPSRRRNSALSA